MRKATLLVPVRAVSGRTYPAGTTVTVSGTGEVAEAFVDGDWVPLSWWEFSVAGVPTAEFDPQ